MDPIKIEAINSWPLPKNIKELRGFLGLTGYYKRFIQGYGILYKPLTELLKKNKFSWTEKSTEAFHKLKDRMVTKPLLALPNFEEEFVVETDACEESVGAVLVQQGKPITYMSKALSEKYKALSIYEKEMLAIVLALQRWRPYLLGRRFKIKTDHQSLKFLIQQRILTPMQQKWLVKLMGYDYEIIYKKGKENVAADALSRKPVGETLPITEAKLTALSIANSELWENIQKQWIEDPELVQLIQQLQQDNQSNRNYLWARDQLTRKGKLVVGTDEAIKQTILQEFHNSAAGGHSGLK